MSKSRSCRVKLEPILTGITPPRIIKTAVLPGKRAESLFIAEPNGEISTVEFDHDWYLKSFLDVSDLAMEGGLHGLEFHPDFSENGRFYLHYSVRDSDSQDSSNWNDYNSYHHYDTIEEWILPDTGVPICIRTLLNIKWPRPDHNGMNTLGWNNGCLILLTGNGGSSSRAQENTSLLGKVIAINVDYRLWKFEKDPPPVFEVNELDPIRKASLKIVAKGLVDPSGFDVDGPIKYLTDVGEKILAFTRWKRNFGSGNGSDCHKPAASYISQEGRVIGGCVYHGQKIPNLVDRYVFADTNGSIFSIRSLLEDDEESQIPCPLTTEEDNLTLTALGSNRRKTRIFIGGYNDGVGGLYELVPQ